MKHKLVFIWMVFVCFACKKDDDKTITMDYAQTQCNDEWGIASETTPSVVVKYFNDEKNVPLNSVKIFVKDSSAAVCLACTCVSGKTIRAEVPERFKGVMETNKFIAQ